MKRGFLGAVGVVVAALVVYEVLSMAVGWGMARIGAMRDGSR